MHGEGSPAPGRPHLTLPEDDALAQLTAQGQEDEPREKSEVPWWFVGLVVLILWGPLVGAAIRPYRPPD